MTKQLDLDDVAAQSPLAKQELEQLREHLKRAQMASATPPNSIRALAWITPKGRVHADTRFANETDAWFIALGWPGDEEVEQAKKEGHRVEWVTIVLQN